MYDENDNIETGRVNPEANKEETVTTIFIMRDPEPKRNSLRTPFPIIRNTVIREHRTRPLTRKKERNEKKAISEKKQQQ